MRTLRGVEVLDRAAAQVGEGPAWDAARGELVWVDITRNQVRFSRADGTLDRVVDVGVHVGAALPGDTGWLLATRGGVAVLDLDGGVTEVLDLQSDRPGLRCNDAKCDPRGRPFVGTMAYDLSPGVATLYRLDRGPTATVVFDRLTLANGLGWSPDGTVLWFVDSATQGIARYAYDPDEGTVGAHLGTIGVPAAHGMPDGLCVDDDGCAWVGLWGGSAVHRYTPDGRVDTVVALPASQITSCAFGGPGRSTLHITSATHALSPDALDREPLAGALFGLDLSTAGITGPAATPWRPLT